MAQLPTESEITYSAGDAAGPWVTAVKRLWEHYVEGLAVQKPTTLTISAGAVTPTQGAHLVDTEAQAAADDLVKIGTGTINDGRWVALRRAVSGRDVTLKHAAGGVGQVVLAGGADFTLSADADLIILERVGTDWIEVLRTAGDPPAATTDAAGIVELATSSEAQAGTDATRAVTPAGLAAAVPAATTSAAGKVELATDAEAAAGTDGTRAVTPAALDHVLSGFSAVPAGAVLPYGGASPPSGWLECDGSAVSRSTYADLFSAIGEAWGAGDGSTTFNLPDLRGRFPLGAGTGPGLTARTLADTGGEEDHQLTEAEMPSHTHQQAYDDNDGSGISGNSINDSGQSGMRSLHDSHSEPAGGDQPHNNMPPYAALVFIVKT